MLSAPAICDVAGGLLHPLTPRNKLIWKGEEGFAATTELLQASKVRTHLMD
jgi:hypothetical protein